MILSASRKLGKYEIRQKLGRGGMADVYLAQDMETGAIVALKLIEHSPDPDTCDFIDAERRGVVLQARLADVDPHVVRVYESGDLDGYFFVAMEYIDGQDLAELMRGGRLEVEFATDVAVAVASTLESAHSLQVTINGKEYRGVIHGDIKPKNIRIDSHAEVRVLDFGIAKALSLSRKITRNEFGSVPYSSPERLDFGEVNAHSDLWSLAVMLYEMVTGNQPYHADTTERLESLIRSRMAAPPAPEPCPDPLRRILLKAMAPDPALRYATASEFRGDLLAFRNGSAEGLAADAIDLDATRRTHVGQASPPASPSDPDVPTARTAIRDVPTAKTNGVQAAAAGGKAFGTGRAQTPASKPKRRANLGARIAIAILLACLVYGVVSAAGDVVLYRHGQAFARELQAEQLTDPADIWEKWTELSKNNSSSVLLRGPRGLVKARLIAATDHVIDSYRNSEGLQDHARDWERARTMASHVLAMDPDDTIRGKLRLCEGHLSRLGGGSHLSAAIEQFTEAQHLMPKSPDPELGLLRVYLVKDIDKANQSLEDARKLGFQPGDRFLSQLADRFMARADRLYQVSQDLRGLPQEKDQLQRASEDYKHALQLYQEAASNTDTSSSIHRVQVSLDNVSLRLQQIENGINPANGDNGTQIHRGMAPGEVLRRILRSIKPDGQWL